MVFLGGGMRFSVKLIFKVVIFKVIVAWLFIFSGPAYGETCHEIIDQFEKGRINWSKRFVEAEGVGWPLPGMSEGSENQRARDKAMIMAQQDVYRNLLETVKKLQVTGTQTLGDIVKKKDTTLSAVETLLHDAPVVKTDYLTDGSVKIKAQIGLDGALSQLILPAEIIQLESIHMENHQQKHDQKDNYSGIIIDVRGLPFKPAMSLKLIDESNKEVYGPKYVSRECSVQWGICEYAKQIDLVKMAKRLGNNPLMVKGIKLKPSSASTIIISNTDVSKIRDSVENLVFLKECRVVIVMDGILPEPKSRK